MPRKEKVVYCDKCGINLEYDSGFCSACGAALDKLSLLSANDRHAVADLLSEAMITGLEDPSGRGLTVAQQEASARFISDRLDGLSTGAHLREFATELASRWPCYSGERLDVLSPTVESLQGDRGGWLMNLIFPIQADLAGAPRLVQPIDAALGDIDEALDVCTRAIEEVTALHGNEIVQPLFLVGRYQRDDDDNYTGARLEIRGAVAPEHYEAVADELALQLKLRFAIAHAEMQQ